MVVKFCNDVHLSLGLILNSYKSVNTLWVAQHKAIAAKFQLLERKTREFADSVVEEFRQMFDVVAINPTNIEEKITEMRDNLAALPGRIELLNERIGKNDSHFALIEGAKWQIPVDLMDMRWEKNMSAEIAKQEKNMRVLEFQFKRSMEEEQQEFSADLLNLQSDVSKLGPHQTGRCSEEHRDGASHQHDQSSPTYLIRARVCSAPR